MPSRFLTGALLADNMSLPDDGQHEICADPDHRQRSSCFDRPNPAAVQDLLNIMLPTGRRELDDARLPGRPDCTERRPGFGER
jgi:hypothetical protein